jgi:hypothetical protein
LRIGDEADDKKENVVSINFNFGNGWSESKNSDLNYIHAERGFVIRSVGRLSAVRRFVQVGGGGLSRRALHIRVRACFGPITLIGIQGFQIIIAAIQFISFTIVNLAELHR